MKYFYLLEVLFYNFYFFALSKFIILIIYYLYNHKTTSIKILVEEFAIINKNSSCRSKYLFFSFCKYICNSYSGGSPVLAMEKIKWKYEQEFDLCPWASIVTNPLGMWGQHGNLQLLAPIMSFFLSIIHITWSLEF